MSSWLVLCHPSDIAHCLPPFSANHQLLLFLLTLLSCCSLLFFRCFRALFPLFSGSSWRPFLLLFRCCALQRSSLCLFLLPLLKGFEHAELAEYLHSNQPSLLGCRGHQEGVFQSVIITFADHFDADHRRGSICDRLDVCLCRDYSRLCLFHSGIGKVAVAPLYLLQDFQRVFQQHIQLLFVTALIHCHNQAMQPLFFVFILSLVPSPRVSRIFQNAFRGGRNLLFHFVHQTAYCLSVPSQVVQSR
mmetsp:Transcript_39919/g.102943  ORF Transcript_39919/g.102943 Transcript_39919/m.102943 type:complete len:246 (+) Transcript_39919:5611-6348(+)